MVRLPPRKPIPRHRPLGKVQTSQSWVGPVPPPQALRAFGEIEPSFPERIMRMAEEASAHQRAMEGEAMTQQKAALAGDRSFRTRGQWFAAALAGFFGFLGGWFVHLGHSTSGASVILGTVVSLAIVFVLGRRPASP